MHEMWRESPVVAKLGFLWYDAKHAPPGHLILAHNLVRYDGAPGNSLPRGVKDLALWRDRCDVVEKTDLARCVGMRLHRKRLGKYHDLMGSGVCLDKMARPSGVHSGKVERGKFARAVAAARFAPYPRRRLYSISARGKAPPFAALDCARLGWFLQRRTAPRSNAI